MFKLIIGIPSYNEADTISNVTKQIDLALKALNLNVEGIIVNSDNQSTDQTVKNFNNTNTLHKKISLTTVFQGKGRNVKNIFEYAIAENADAVIFFDSDLATVSSEWLKAMTLKLVEGYEAVFTRRIPIWNYGDLTYHLTFPVISNFFNATINQPISGEFGFSKKFIKKSLERNWDDNVLGYGIDFYLATIASKLNWCEIILDGKKDHKLRSYNTDKNQFITMNPKFKEVLLTIKKTTSINFPSPPPFLKSKPINKTFGELKWRTEKPPFKDKEIEALKESVLRKYASIGWQFDQYNTDLKKYFSAIPFKGIPNKTWLTCLLKFLYADDTIENSDNQLEIIENIFLARVIGFFHQIAKTNNWYQIVEKNAEELKDLV